MQYIAWIILGIVACGVFYAFTAKESILKQQMQDTPVLMKLIGVFFFAIASFILYKSFTSQYEGAGWMPAVGVCLILAVSFFINFGDNHKK